MKCCSMCERTLPLDAFFASNTASDKLQTSCRSCQAVYGAKWRAENKARLSARTRAKKVGLTVEQFYALDLTSCDVCSAVLGPDKAHLDHDHATGKFRGVLCGGCNWALGNVRDSSSTLRALADYLEAHSGA